MPRLQHDCSRVGLAVDGTAQELARSNGYLDHVFDPAGTPASADVRPSIRGRGPDEEGVEEVGRAPGTRSRRNQ
jgi:hypothetical protein